MEIRHTQGEALGLVVNIAKADELAKGFQSIQDSWGRLELVVANAGING